jgi:cell division protein FtsN
MPRPGQKSGGAAGLFVLLGILTILGVTFAAGTYAGRIWATRPHMGPAATSAEGDGARRGVEARGARMPEPAPRLTFYQELTAPLTAPPPPPKPAKTPPPPLVTSGTVTGKRGLPDKPGARVERDVAEKVAPDTVRPPTIHGASRFTIQVGAYRLRPPAEALRTTLTAAGHDARVVETDAPNGVRFRVQIGDFSSRDAARDAAARLTGPTFVTTR